MADDRATPRFSPTIALTALARGVEVRVAASLEPHGLTLRKYGLLQSIARTPGVSLSALARSAGITVQSVHAAIHALVDGGLVRSVVEHAGQAANLSVTRRGTAVLAEVEAEIADLDAEIFAEERMDALAAALAEATASPQAEPQD